MKRIGLVALFLLIGGGLLWTLTGTRDRDNTLRVTGRVEMDEVIIKTEVPGRVNKLFAGQGQEVSKGQPLAQIDDEPLRLERKVLERQIEAKEEALKAKKAQLAYLEAQVGAIIKQAEASLNQARIKFDQANIELKRRQSQHLRFKALLKEGVSPKEKYEEIERAYLQAKRQVEAARAQVHLSEARLNETKALPLKVKALRQEILALKKEVSALRARLQRLDLDIEKTTIKAPSRGLIYRKLTEEGEVLPLLGPVYILLRPENLHVKTFLPERWLAKVRVGQKVEVYTDAYPDRAFEGHICYIADRAEFTPKEIDTSEERVKQVFETKVCFQGPVPELKKGMPVDVVITQGE